MFETRLAAHGAALEAVLADILGARPLDDEIARPERLFAAMRHGALSGGKRLRPFLLVESAALFGVRGDAVMRVAAALECVHCYSLIHDDLPAMDDDDLRRGRPTVHRAFDEATAILAGDSLLTCAFAIIADDRTELPERVRLDLVAHLARAAGGGGMAGGQALDLEAERGQPGEEDILRLQAMKTGALIRYATQAGAVIGNAGEADVERLGAYGSAIGLAFQLSDDLLDLTSSAQAMGKATGKDTAAGKATLPRLHGVDWTRKQLSGLVEQAEDLLAPFGDEAHVLKLAARFIATRRR